MVNLFAKVPKAAQQAVATLVRSIYAQPDADSTHAQCDQAIEHLEDRYSAAADLLGNAREELLAFTAFPKAVWGQIWSNNPLERLNKETRRRTDVVGIFPNRPTLIRLVGSVLAEQNDEWIISRRYMSLEVIAAALTPKPIHQHEEDLIAINAFDRIESGTFVHHLTGRDLQRRIDARRFAPIPLPSFTGSSAQFRRNRHAGDMGAGNFARRGSECTPMT